MVTKDNPNKLYSFVTGKSRDVDVIYASSSISIIDCASNIILLVKSAAQTCLTSQYM